MRLQEKCEEKNFLGCSVQQTGWHDDLKNLVKPYIFSRTFCYREKNNNIMVCFIRTKKYPTRCMT